MSPDAFLFVLIFIIVDSIFRLLADRRAKKEVLRDEVKDKVAKKGEKRPPPVLLPFPAPKQKPTQPPLFRRKFARQRFTSEIQKIISEQLGYFNEELDIRPCNLFSGKGFLYRDSSRWSYCSQIICCFVDIQDSTKLSVKLDKDDRQGKEDLARIYRLFTETAVDIFRASGSNYYDIKGDGVFAIYHPSKPHEALATLITFKTFVDTHFTPAVRRRINYDIFGHYGIDQGDVLVRRFGRRGTDSENNAVWAGQPINIAVKLSGLGSDNRIRVSSRFFENLNREQVISTLAPSEELPPDDRFDFEKIYVFDNNWSERHGDEQYRKLVNLDKSLSRTPVRALVKLFMDIWNQKL